MASSRLDLASISPYDWMVDVDYVTVIVDDECFGWLVDCDSDMSMEKPFYGLILFLHAMEATLVMMELRCMAMPLIVWTLSMSGWWKVACRDLLTVPKATISLVTWF